MVVTRTDQDHLFASWVAFTADLQQDTYLRNIPSNTHLEFLIVFACRYRHGLLSQSLHPIGTQCMEEALHAMGQAFT